MTGVEVLGAPAELWLGFAYGAAAALALDVLFRVVRKWTQGD
jgi:hypothetical protein